MINSELTIRESCGLTSVPKVTSEEEKEVDEDQETRGSIRAFSTSNITFGGGSIHIQAGL